MRLGLPGEKKPSAIKKISPKEKIVRAATAGGIILGSIVAGAVGEGTTHVFSKVTNKVVRTLEKADNTDYGASSAGIPSQQTVEGMRKANIPVAQPKK